MKLPKAKAVDRQQRLFAVDKALTSKGETRWATGEFFEEAVAEACGGKRLRTDASADICPDVKIAEGLFAESKAVGRTGSVIFYEGRYLKDRDFMATTGHKIIYWFWRHQYPVLTAQSYGELRAGLAASLTELVIADADLLYRAVDGKPTRQVNSGQTAAGGRLGYGNAAKGYGIGWTLRLSFFAERSELLPTRLRMQVYGHQVSLTVRVSQPELAGLVERRLVESGKLF